MAGAVRDDSYESAALPVLEDGGIRFERLSDLDCAKRWPQINLYGSVVERLRTRFRLSCRAPRGRGGL